MKVLTLVCMLGLLLPSSAMAVDLNTFKDVQFETHVDRVHGIAIEYPYLWGTQPKRSKNEIFRVADQRQLPSLAISIQPRLADLSLSQSAAAATQALGKDVTILSNKEIDLGGTPAWEVTVDWVLPIYGGIKLRNVMISVYRGDEWIVITGTDGRTVDGLYPQLVEALRSARLIEPTQQAGVGK